LVRTHCDRLHPYQPAVTTERQLDLYCRQRRSLLDLATKIELKLISTLKQYFPVALEQGGRDNGGVRLHPEHGPDYFAAFVFDPDGHRIEAVVDEQA
jgi:hypothetical protein